MKEFINKNYQLWLEKATDQTVIKELKSIENNETKIEDAFYKELEFGTGGLRGVLGAGTNRLNIYTVAKVSQGLANYVKQNFQPKDWKIAVCYDSRNMSKEFAEVSSGVFAANGITAHIFKELMPTPCLSYALRELNCASGIIITASHNPAKYNGYKVYGADGCQITTQAATLIYKEIQATDVFKDVKNLDFNEGLSTSKIQYISDDIYTNYTKEVLNQSLLGNHQVDKNISIVYTPLHGAGLKPVIRALSEGGYTNIKVVKEQEQPDGNFTTCPYPNPEIKETLQLGIEYAKKYDADLVLATDPDCDRVGIAVRDFKGELVLLSGNEVGILLLDYICRRRVALKTMPKDPVLVKTIVSTDMAEVIAKSYGVRTIDVLTGFKFIGEQIGILEKEGNMDSYIFGFEESYGYLSGPYVRDKDAVNGAFLICEMFAYYESLGLTLLDILEDLYEEFGYSYNTLYSFEFEGSQGFKKMQNIMKDMRCGIDAIGTKKVLELVDYNGGLNGLPKSDVLKFVLEGNNSIIVRPSGTEPKIKLYISVNAENREAASIMATRKLTALKERLV
ncbi:phospho-sugar mutase [Tannockella kyphosi]|uniref:phospho-sugar mutase n=1 Tax=Tannockella kyphosi TaxID=2899121 RepID=UPI002011FBA7|nr:phospho-sugar mutase [Tannockella kyphosi]